MPDLAALVTVPRTAHGCTRGGPLDLGLFDEHVATTLPGRIGQHNPPTHKPRARIRRLHYLEHCQKHGSDPMPMSGWLSR